MLRGHFRRRWLTNRIVVAGSVLIAAVVFLVRVGFQLTPAVLAAGCAAYLATALRRWQRQAEGFEITPERVRSGVGDLLEPAELRAEDILGLEDAYDAPIPMTWRESLRNDFSLRRRKPKPAPTRDRP